MPLDFHTLCRTVLPWLAGAAIGLAGAGGVLAGDATSLRIATEGAYPPFNYTEDNQLKGFEVDLGKALCERMGVTCTFVSEEWERLIPGLKHRRFDAVMASLEVTDERRRRIGFSKPYYRTPAAFMGRKGGSFPGVTADALAGRRIGAVAGTPYAQWLEQRVGDRAEIRLYASQDEASLDLALERIDLVLGDKIALQEWLKRGKEAECCAFLADAPRDTEIFGKGYGVGLRQDDARLRDRFDAALDAIRADGTYDRIRAAWFPFDVY